MVLALPMTHFHPVRLNLLPAVWSQWRFKCVQTVNRVMLAIIDINQGL